jgi:hypothetical protein
MTPKVVSPLEMPLVTYIERDAFINVEKRENHSMFSEYGRS